MMRIGRNGNKIHIYHDEVTKKILNRYEVTKKLLNLPMKLQKLLTKLLKLLTKLLKRHGVSHERQRNFSSHEVTPFKKKDIARCMQRRISSTRQVAER